MNTMTITNPDTNKSVSVRVWDVDTKAALESIRADGVKAFSWSLLSQKHSVRAMETTESGDSAANNFALNVLENALDWSLGLAVHRFIRDCLGGAACIAPGVPCGTFAAPKCRTLRGPTLGDEVGR